MSHRLPPEDRAPGLRFMAWILGFMGAILGIWYGVFAVVT